MEFFARRPIERDKDGSVLTKEIWYKRITNQEEKQNFLSDGFVIETKQQAIETLNWLEMSFDRNRSDMSGWLVFRKIIDMPL